MPSFIAYAAILCTIAASTRAALYPNRPVANTVFEAGKEATITWIDDESKPHLNEMPKLQLDLYGPDDKMLHTFEKDLDPNSKRCSIMFSPEFLGGGGSSSGYYLRFHAPKPPVDIYTARFTISNGANQSPGGPPYNNAAAFNASSSSAVTNAKIAPVMPAGGPVPPNSSAAPPQNIAMEPTTMPAAPAPAAGTLTSATVVPHATVGAAGLGVANAASGLLKFAGELDMEAIKFRLVFILWPALMGITLAL
ncbi:hypothetical protein PENSPDRAFT_23087 [Peniophora sp. CONT]|nr:hypothetical protein PENSPDRAFT_23087 [Peniophora sp. CONT]